MIAPESWLGNGETHVELASCYAIDIIAGKNIRLNDLRAASIKEYLKSVNTLFIDRGFLPPINFALPKEPPALFYENVRLWETEPNRRTHLSPEFLAELFTRAKKDTTGLGFIRAMSDFTILGRYTGIRLSEYGQPTQKRPLSISCHPGKSSSHS